jgi:hypothetical protein
LLGASGVGNVVRKVERKLETWIRGHGSRDGQHDDVVVVAIVAVVVVAVVVVAVIAAAAAAACSER